MYVQLSGTFASGQVSRPDMAILKINRYLENCCPHSGNNLNIDPLGRMRVYVQLLKLLPMAKLVLAENVKAHALLVIISIKVLPFIPANSPTLT